MRISTFSERGMHGASTVWRTVHAQPSWIGRLALLTFVLVIGLPILLLFLLAVLLAAAVFSVLAALYTLYARVRGILPRRDGRENVRIVRRM